MKYKTAKYIIPPVICITILIAVWFSSPAYKKTVAIDAKIISPRIETIQNSVICKGTIESRTKKAVYTSMPVTIENIAIEVGDIVNEGDTLFTAVPYDGIIDGDLSEMISEGIAGDGILSVFNQLFSYAEKSSPEISTANIISDSEAPVNVLSPISGMITEINIQPSAVVSLSTACLVVSNIDDLIVRCSVAEEFVQDISEGMNCIITSDSFRDMSCVGTIEKIMPFATQVQTLTGTGSTVVEILVSVDKGILSRIKPGYSAKVEILSDMRKNAITAPYEAVRQSEDGREYVYTVLNDCAVKTYIETGYELEDSVEVISGLSGNESIVVSPSESIFDGCKIKAVSAR